MYVYILYVRARGKRRGIKLNMTTQEKEKQKVIRNALQWALPVLRVHFLLMPKLIRTVLHVVRVMVGLLQGHVGDIILVSLVAAVRRHKDVEPSGHAETGNDEKDDEVGDEETKDVGAVVAVDVELVVGKGEDDSEDGGRNISQKRAPEGGNAPVLPGTDHEVEVSA